MPCAPAAHAPKYATTGRAIQGLCGGCTHNQEGLEFSTRPPSQTFGTTTMIDYTVTYRLELGTFFAQALGFPEASAFAGSLPEARQNLMSALRLAAEQLLRRGDHSVGVNVVPTW